VATTKQLAGRYVRAWVDRGYPSGIPDEVPHELMRRSLAPSYKAVALAILNNDMHLTSLGFSAPYSNWYDTIKKIEISKRKEVKKMPATDRNVQERIKQLRSTGSNLDQVANQLNSEGIPSLSGKPWSTYMVMNYGKAAGKKPESVAVKPTEATPRSRPSTLEARVAVLESMLMDEIRKNIDLQTKLASAAVVNA
jgi:hypothetical protein